jgi:putrescine importer
MASVYPSAGSAYTYVAQEIHPGLGFITGRGMLLDYTLVPLICTIWCAEQSHAFVRTSVCLENLVRRRFYRVQHPIYPVIGTDQHRHGCGHGRGGRVVFVAAAHYIIGPPHTDSGFFTRPFYDPQTFSYGGLLGTTSIAVLTYIGFDGISTLSEETVNPRM